MNVQELTNKLERIGELREVEFETEEGFRYGVTHVRVDKKANVAVLSPRKPVKGPGR